jgi:hypothetical protein
MDMADMKEANIRAARTVADRAQAIGPNRTGRLVGSLRTPRTAAKAVVRSNLVYAPVIHYGWPRRHIRPQPFLPVAAAQTRDTWLAAYEKDLQHLLDQVEGM